MHTVDIPTPHDLETYRKQVSASEYKMQKNLTEIVDKIKEKNFQGYNILKLQFEYSESGKNIAEEIKKVLQYYGYKCEIEYDIFLAYLTIHW